MKFVIIGNGFDLHCGLKSSFKDFFFQKILNKDGQVNVASIRSNIWYLLFYFRYIRGVTEGVCEFVNKNNPLWMDVENFISTILNEENGTFTKHPLIVINNIFNNKITYPNNIDDFDYILSSSFKDQESELAFYINKNKKTNDPYEFLLSELKKFESDFCEYLQKEVSNNMTYKYSVKDLVNDVVGKNNRAFYLDFNYTNIPTNDIVLHVHGNLKDNNIIVGTDISSLAKVNKQKAFRFTKAWRKMNGNMESTTIPPRSEITEIVIYGHSLSQQDYAYFHSIFSYYDIYNSSVILTFLYSDYEYIDGEKLMPNVEKNEQNKQLYVDKIFNLLRNYVKNRIDTSEADAIITKIQLENRIKIMELCNYASKNLAV